MKLYELQKILEEYAPLSLSDEYVKTYSVYDNSGIIFDFGGEIQKAVCALDFSLNAVDRAVKEGAQVIITHHPAIYGGIKRVDGVFAKKVAACAKNGISVISMHLNMDCTKEGIDEYLMRGVASSVNRKIKDKKIFEPLSEEGCGYGRGYEIEKTSFSALLSGMKKTFSSDRILSYGEEGEISRIASFCGAGADEKAVYNALSFGADVLISSDFKHHIIAMAREEGLKIINLTHYASENYAFEIITKKILSRAEIPYVYVTDDLF